jgi:hypothetical protein
MATTSVVCSTLSSSSSLVETAMASWRTPLWVRISVSSERESRACLKAWMLWRA